MFLSCFRDFIVNPAVNHAVLYRVAIGTTNIVISYKAGAAVPLVESTARRAKLRAHPVWLRSLAVFFSI